MTTDHRRPCARCGHDERDVRPQEAHVRAIDAVIAHEATHPLGWRLPCRTCRALQADVDRLTEACQRAASDVQPAAGRHGEGE